MNIFASLKIYAGKWSVKSVRVFTSEEINSVTLAIVVPSLYGNSVEFSMTTGGKTYIPLDQSSTLNVGEVVDLTKAKLTTLQKVGEDDIVRVTI